MNTFKTITFVFVALWMATHSARSFGQDAQALKDMALAATNAPAPEGAANFHHVRLNVTDPEQSSAYYQKFFSAVPLKFRGVADAVFTDRSYIIFNKVDKPAPENEGTALWHIGWGGIDGPSEHKWRTEQGIKWAVDLTPVGGDFAHFMYAAGPDKEEVEIWTGTPNQRFNHVHLLAKDPNVTRDWYIDNLGAMGDKKYIPNPGPLPKDVSFDSDVQTVFTKVWNTTAVLDGVMFNIFSKPDETSFWYNGKPIKEFQKSDGHAINHIAFSYPDIQPVFDRMKKNGVEIVKEISWNDELKIKSFFVRGPDKVLIEILEAAPLPQSSWQNHLPSKTGNGDQSNLFHLHPHPHEDGTQQHPHVGPSQISDAQTSK